MEIWNIGDNQINIKVSDIYLAHGAQLINCNEHIYTIINILTQIHEIYKTSQQSTSQILKISNVWKTKWKYGNGEPSL
jgi:hypothetical protein